MTTSKLLVNLMISSGYTINLSCIKKVLVGARNRKK